jgi:imidazolonepropionase-like amidohydrolase
VEQRGTNGRNALRLHRAGVTILAGSDCQSGVFAGAGLHRELAQMVGAGFTPMDAIRAATVDPAIFLSNGEEPEFGIVAVGKRADLLLVEGDPSRDIEALGRIRQVFLEGVPLERVPVGEAAGGDARD